MARRKIKPCPVCNGLEFTPNMKKGCVWVGPISSMVEGVRCTKCRLQVDETFKDDYPKNVPKNLTGMAVFRWLRRFCLSQAIQRWNALPRK